MNEVTNCLNCIPIAKHQQIGFLYYFPLFSLTKKTDKGKDKSARHFPQKFKTYSKAASMIRKSRSHTTLGLG